MNILNAAVVEEFKSFKRQYDETLSKYPQKVKDDADKSLEELKDCLQNGKPLPASFKPHKVGEKWEVHLVSRGSDILVTYRKYRMRDGTTLFRLLECIPHKKLKAELQAILANARERELTDDECLRAYDLYCRLYGAPKVR